MNGAQLFKTPSDSSGLMSEAPAITGSSAHPPQSPKPRDGGHPQLDKMLHETRATHREKKKSNHGKEGMK